MSLMMPEKPTNVTELSDIIRQAKSIVAVTGAGISASAGIRTYRDRGSKWTNEDMQAKSHASRYVSHLPEMWQFWGALRKQSLEVDPTPAHLALSDPRVKVLTQNIDGLHTRAGNNVIELHGSILRTRGIKKHEVAYEDTYIPEPGEIPKYRGEGKSGQKTRPDIVLFGEDLKGKNVKTAVEWLRAADVLLYIGTSGNVFPVADFIQAAGQAVTVLINKDAWQPPFGRRFDLTLLGDADDIVPSLFT